jgi:phospholipase/carboxylesterase
MTALIGPMMPATSGKADSLVIFLHGYGANGDDLFGLSHPMASQLPNTTFIAPNAPEICAVNPMGYQWFGIPHMDGTPAATAKASMQNSVALLNTFLDEAEAQTGVPASRTILFGFSQGTMMSLHVGPRRKQQLAGIIGFSGRLLEPDSLADEIVTKPPVLLIHGDRDEVVPHSSMNEAASALSKAGLETFTHTSKGLGHGIDPEGLTLAMQFIQGHLNRPV